MCGNQGTVRVHRSVYVFDIVLCGSACYGYLSVWGFQGRPVWLRFLKYPSLWEDLLYWLVFVVAWVDHSGGVWTSFFVGGLVYGCLFGFVFAVLPVYLPACLSVSVSLCFCFSLCLRVCVSPCLCLRLSVCLSVCLLLSLSVCLSLSLCFLFLSRMCIQGVNCFSSSLGYLWI